MGLGRSCAATFAIGLGYPKVHNGKAAKRAASFDESSAFWPSRTTGGDERVVGQPPSSEGLLASEEIDPGLAVQNGLAVHSIHEFAVLGDVSSPEFIVAFRVGKSVFDLRWRKPRSGHGI